MLHYLHFRSWDIAASPIGVELDRLGVEHRFLIFPIDFTYRHPFRLFLVIYPTLIWRCLVMAVRSARATPSPSAIVLSSTIEAFVFGTVFWLFRARSMIVFQTLIITPRSNKFFNIFYMAFWRLLINLITIGICHSRQEVLDYSRMFPRHASKFTYIPFGTTINVEDQSCAGDPGLPVIVTAGRSGRDYPTLSQAVQGLECKLKIVCDIGGPVTGIVPSDQVEIVSKLYGEGYLRLLASATIVVVPISLNDISAGQMVFLQASALRKPIIITRTRTTTDYAEQGQNAVLVPLGNVAELRSAIVDLMRDADRRARLGACARARFDRDHTTESYVRRLVSVIEGWKTGNHDR